MYGAKLKKNKNMSLRKEVFEYKDNETVFIPLITMGNTDFKLEVKPGDKVLKGQVIANQKNGFKMPIHASVSGEILEVKPHMYLNGGLVDCIVIKNDKKEKEVPQENREDINKIPKKEFLNIIKEAGIVGMGGAGFPTYVKYDTNSEIKTLIVNAVECEPYITADYMILKKHAAEILEAIDAIMEINKIEECFIAIKKGNIDIKKALQKYIGTYIKVKIKEVPDIYPMGWERVLVRHIKGATYQKVPIEKGIIVNNASTIYAIYEALKYNKPVTERIVTLSGEMFRHPQNVLVKIGTEIKEVIRAINGLKRFKNVNFVAGGPMMGNAITDDSLIVSKELNCILVLKQHLDERVHECFRCGKCVDVCPALMCPVLIKDNIDNIDNLKTLEPNRCCECGLCTYICPAKIKLREFVRLAKEKVK